ncbi:MULTISPECIES: RHS repeat domain-containing protein, partial [Bacteroidales]
EVSLYTYDKDGMLVKAKNSENLLEFTRDRKTGQIIEEKQGEHIVSRTYDGEGNCTRITSSLGADIRHTYDREGNLQTMQAGESWQASWVRDNTGLEVQRTFSGGVTVSTERDRFGREVRKSVRSGGIERGAYRYEWGIANRLLSKENELTGTVMRYDYDRFDFLIRQETTQGSETDVIYRVPDFVGNLFGTPDRKDRKYGAGGKLLEDPDCFYHYDDEGNLIFREFKQLQETGVRYDRKRMEKERGIRCLATGTGWLYEWASNGMLKKVIRPDGRPVEFRYDALGRRTAKQYFGKVTHWVWDGNVPIHEWSYRISDMQPDKEENGPSKEPTEDITTWVFEVGTFVPTAKIQEGKQYSIVSDYLGTPIQMYNELGNKIWECTLDIFGEVTNFEGNSLNDCPFRYQGQYKDEETELYYNRFRYYSQEIGGYLSQDPIRLAGNNPTIYGYVRDTCTNTDPFGLMPWPNPINSGHHLVYANKARSVGLDHLASNTDTPTYFFNEPYAPGTHERVHASQRKFVGPRQGPWTGSAEELIEASKKGLIGLDDIKGKLIIPSTGEILAENATPLEAFEKLEEWHKRKMASIH